MWYQDEPTVQQPLSKLSFLNNDQPTQPSMSFLNCTFEKVSSELANNYQGSEEIAPKEEILDTENKASDVEITLEVQDLEKLVDNSTDFQIKTELTVESSDKAINSDDQNDNTSDQTDQKLESLDPGNIVEQPELVKKKRKTTSQKRKWPEDPADCDICGTHYTTKRSYQRHYKIVHELISYNCKHCGKEFRWPDKLTAHVNLVHLGIKPKTFPCEKCGKVCKEPRKLRDHMKRHPLPSCESCKVAFKDMDGLQEHIRVDHLMKYCNN